MNLTKDILLLAHYLVMFNECCKFMFLLRQASTVACFMWIINFMWTLIFYCFKYCKHTRLTCVLINWWWWWCRHGCERSKSSKDVSTSTESDEYCDVSVIEHADDALTSETTNNNNYQSLQLQLYNLLQSRNSVAAYSELKPPGGRPWRCQQNTNIPLNSWQGRNFGLKRGVPIQKEEKENVEMGGLYPAIGYGGASWTFIVAPTENGFSVIWYPQIASADSKFFTCVLKSGVQYRSPKMEYWYPSYPRELCLCSEILLIITEADLDPVRGNPWWQAGPDHLLSSYTKNYQMHVEFSRPSWLKECHIPPFYI